MLKNGSQKFTENFLETNSQVIFMGNLILDLFTYTVKKCQLLSKISVILFKVLILFSKFEILLYIDLNQIVISYE